jgi:transposase, IS5 family
VLIPAIEAHQRVLDRTPYLVAADAAFYSRENDAQAKAMGVKRVSIPNRSTKSPARKCEQKKRWFRNGQKWRTGCEGRISVTKRRHGLNRCRYKGDRGMERWVGIGVIADTLHRSRYGTSGGGALTSCHRQTIFGPPVTSGGLCFARCY